MTIRYGSLFTGGGGLDMAVEMLWPDSELAWVAENDKHASVLLAARLPGVPNLGDLREVDWAEVEPVDVLVGGYPCQPYSLAGKRKGFDDERDGWPWFRDAIGALRPRLVLLENVPGHLALGAARTVGDLAALGYDARWGTLRAADVGAPHGRERWFCVARADRAGPQGLRSERERAGERAAGPHGVEPSAHPPSVGRPEGRTEPDGRRATASSEGTAADAAGEQVGTSGLSREGSRRPAADACGQRHGGGQDPRGLGHLDREDAGEARQRERAWQESGDRGTTAPADADSQRLREHAGGSPPQEAGPLSSDELAGDRGPRPAVEWGAYLPAIRRWEHILRRPTPAPTDTDGRLSPAFVEWMMGWPEGWVTGPDIFAPGRDPRPDRIGRNAALKVLGNGVVPLQAFTAYSLLLADLTAEMAA